MSKTVLFVLCISLLALGFLGCSTVGDRPADTKVVVPPLRVGVTPNYPPIIYKQGGKVTGLEADMARALARQMGRPVRFVELDWELLINALLEGKIDIIMSGMSVTEARKVRLDFAEPYLKSGLAMAVRSRDASKYRSLEDAMRRAVTVGVVKGTTSEAFVRRNFSRSTQILPLAEAADAPNELKVRRIDVFVYDAPSVAWIVSENEAELVMLPGIMGQDHLAWAVRRGNDQLLATANTILKQWKSDGSLDRMIRKWLAYYRG